MPHPRFSAVVLVALLAPTLPAAAATVNLTNGDEVTGTVTQQNADGLFLEHPDLGQLIIAAEQIDSVTLEPGDAGYVEPPVPAFFTGWDKTLELGLNGSDGNTDTLNFNAAFRTGYEDDLDRWDFSAEYFRGEEDGETTQDEGNLDVLKDWKVSDQDYFYFATGNYTFDRFTDFESRVAAFVGAGYEFIDDGTYELLGRVGLGGNYEFGDVNDFIPELFFGVEFAWTISDTQEFTAFNRIFPAIDPFFSEFRNNTGVEYIQKIDAGLSLRVGAFNEFNSEVEPGFEENDFRYFARLVYDFR